MTSITQLKKRSKKAGSALMTVFLLLMLMAVAGAGYVAAGTTSIRISNRQQYDIQTTHLCESGIQDELDTLWLDFKNNQNFTDLDTWCSQSTTNTPTSPISGTIPGVGNFSVGVIGYTAVDNYTRTVLLRSVGWVSNQPNGTLLASDPQKIVDVSATYSLSRSGVFDYTYFVNNYGWMDGFGPTDLYVNGDMRANGNFNFTNGSPTVNGSVYACQNLKLNPVAQGLVNAAPLKMTTAQYSAMAQNQPRWRQGYSAAVDGAYGSATYMQNKDLVFDSTGQFINGQFAGALLGDINGIRSWDRTSLNTAGTQTLVDTTPTQEIVMPDLSDLNNYIALSQSYTDPKQDYLNGTPNPLYGKPAYVQTWNSTTNSYQTITTDGVVNGSASLIGTAAHPILIHGPVTFTQDAIIKGNVSGQGTIYTGRNIHIVGSIVYNNPPDFRGASASATDDSNESKDMLGMAARGAVIMGDTSQFTSSYPLQYMTPPFTQGRYDDYGNYIPAYNANNVDSTGHKLYQSVLGDAYIHSVASSVNQIDGIIYTNFVGGGNIGTGGGGVTLNGSIISKDEAMVVFSLPMYENYDNRIRDRGPSRDPLIDIDLPRSPQLQQTSWQDEGFFMGP